MECLSRSCPGTTRRRSDDHRSGALVHAKRRCRPDFPARHVPLVVYPSLRPRRDGPPGAVAGPPWAGRSPRSPPPGEAPFRRPCHTRRDGLEAGHDRRDRAGGVRRRMEMKRLIVATTAGGLLVAPALVALVLPAWTQGPRRRVGRVAGQARARRLGRRRGRRGRCGRGGGRRGGAPRAPVRGHARRAAAVRERPVARDRFRGAGGAAVPRGGLSAASLKTGCIASLRPSRYDCERKPASSRRRGARLVSPVDAATRNVGAGNWKGLGMWAWMLFRVAGIVLVALPVRPHRRDLEALVWSATPP